MAVVSRVAGTPDTRRGYDSGAHYTDAEVAEYWKRRNAGKVRHPSELAVERQEAERQREAERKAANPEPRQSLRDAHIVLRKARDESARISLLTDKAEAMVRDLEAEERRLFEEQRVGDRAIVDRLVETLELGTADDLPVAPAHPTRNAVARRLALARDAHQRLAEEHVEARKQLSAAITAVDQAVVAVGVDVAVAEAERIEALAVELHERRVALWSLSAALSNEQRRLGPWTVRPTPPVVGRAIGAALDGRVDGSWNQRLARLKLDPQAEL